MHMCTIIVLSQFSNTKFTWHQCIVLFAEHAAGDYFHPLRSQKKFPCVKVNQNIFFFLPFCIISSTRVEVKLTQQKVQHQFGPIYKQVEITINAFFLFIFRVFSEFTAKPNGISFKHITYQLCSAADLKWHSQLFISLPKQPQHLTLYSNQANMFSASKVLKDRQK